MSAVPHRVPPKDTLWRKFKRRYWNYYTWTTSLPFVGFSMPFVCALLWLFRASCPFGLVALAGFLWFCCCFSGMLINGFSLWHIFRTERLRKRPNSQFFVLMLLEFAVICGALLMGRIDIAVLAHLGLNTCTNVLADVVNKRADYSRPIQNVIYAIAFLSGSGWIFLASLAVIALYRAMQTRRNLDFWEFVAAKPSRSEYVQKQKEACASGHG